MSFLFLQSDFIILLKLDEIYYVSLNPTFAIQLRIIYACSLW